MSNEVSLLDSKEKNKVISMRIGESAFKHLESLAQKHNSKVSIVARSLLLSQLSNEEIEFEPGDIVVNNSTGIVCILVDKETTSGAEIKAQILGITGKKYVNRK